MRATQRYAVRLVGSLQTSAEQQPCTILDLSFGGALVIANAPTLKMGDRLRLQFVVHRDEAIDCGATVRWRTADAIGVQFDGLRAREVWALGKFLATAEVL